MLTRISMWDDEHGWKRVTASQASAIHPYGLGQANYSKQFLCEVCGQYANFIAGGYQQAHFRHNRNSKDCEQKSTTYNSIYLTNPCGFSLPLKVIIANNAIDVQIGFLPIPENYLQALSQATSHLTIKANNMELAQFNIDSSRFASNRVEYLSVGNKLAEQYKLFYPNTVRQLNVYWPTIVDGISKQGTLFDYESGKRLPRNANVVVGRIYLLITQRTIYAFRSSDITINIERTISGYNIYKVRANNLSRTADDFFRQYGTRLTDAPANLTLLYPYAIRNPHVITHTAEKVWFHKTDGFVEVYPQNLKPQADVFSVNSGFQQVLSLSRFEDNVSVLRYILLRKVQSMSIPIAALSVNVQNNRGETINAGAHSALPPKREIYITSEFDGHIEVCSADYIERKIIFDGGAKTVVDVELNRSYSIYQGLDLVSEISYLRNRQAQIISDDDVLGRLQKFKGNEVPVTQSFGAIASRLNGLPKTAMWLRRQIATGKLDSRAKELLQSIGGR